MNRLKELLLNYCEQYSLELTDEQAELCLQHLSLVIEKNKTVNLTRILNPQDAVALHILDSLILAPYLEDAPSGAMLDMGTGAGFPGIPLAIVSNRRALMIDSVGKKVDAVNDFIDELGLSQAHAVHERLELAADQYRHEFAVVTARALASLPTLVEYAAPFLMKNGLFIVTKGSPSDDELSSGIKAARVCGLDLVTESQLDLPDSLGHRSIYVFKKTKKASIKLPRANGMARKNPLA